MSKISKCVIVPKNRRFKIDFCKTHECRFVNFGDYKVCPFGVREVKQNARYERKRDNG